MFFDRSSHSLVSLWEVLRTNREELSFLTVLALPKASSRGLAEMIWSSSVPWNDTSSFIKITVAFVLFFVWCRGITCIFPECSFLSPPDTAIVAKYWMTRLVLTVFPAPDSPLRWQKYREMKTTDEKTFCTVVIELCFQYAARLT